MRWQSGMDSGAWRPATVKERVCRIESVICRRAGALAQGRNGRTVILTLLAVAYALGRSRPARHHVHLEGLPANDLRHCRTTVWTPPRRSKSQEGHRDGPRPQWRAPRTPGPWACVRPEMGPGDGRGGANSRAKSWRSGVLLLMDFLLRNADGQQAGGATPATPVRPTLRALTCRGTFSCSYLTSRRLRWRDVRRRRRWTTAFAKAGGVHRGIAAFEYLHRTPGAAAGISCGPRHTNGVGLHVTRVP